MDTKDFIVAGLLTGLFILAMISGTVFLTSDNDVNNTLMQDKRINDSFSNFTTSLDNSTNVADKIKETFEEKNPIIAIADLIFTSIIGIGKLITGMFIALYNLTFGLLQDTLGIPPIVMGVFTAILTILLVLSLFKLIKTGR